MPFRAFLSPDLSMERDPTYDIQQNLQQNLQQEIQQNLQQEIQQEIEQSLQQQIRQNMQRNMQQSLIRDLLEQERNARINQSAQLPTNSLESLLQYQSPVGLLHGTQGDSYLGKRRIDDTGETNMEYQKNILKREERRLSHTSDKKISAASITRLNGLRGGFPMPKAGGGKNSISGSSGKKISNSLAKKAKGVSYKRFGSFPLPSRDKTTTIKVSPLTAYKFVWRSIPRNEFRNEIFQAKVARGLSNI